MARSERKSQWAHSDEVAQMLVVAMEASKTTPSTRKRSPRLKCQARVSARGAESFSKVTIGGANASPTAMTTPGKMHAHDPAATAAAESAKAAKRWCARRSTAA